MTQTTQDADGRVAVGLLGLGTVGSGTITLLRRSAAEIERRCGARIEVRRALVRDLRRARSVDAEAVPLTLEPKDILEDPQIQIVVELMGGLEPARTYVEAALCAGKHVVTANKALIAKHGSALFRVADEHGVTLSFEAAVGGGIPIIKTLRESLASNRIDQVIGIVNGTSNYILTEMAQGDASFETALAQAQALGYAEADPTFDVEGIDAAHKLSILAAIAFGAPITFDAVYTEGISHLTAVDIRFAHELGYRIKHLAIAIRHHEGIELRVHPTLVPAHRLMANVAGVMNAVFVRGDAIGEALLYGAGAGAAATASAVVADITDVMRVIEAEPRYRVPHLGFRAGAIEPQPLLPVSEVVTAYYLRLAVIDHPGALAEITRALADAGVSIESLRQLPPSEEGVATLVLLTHGVKEAQLDAALARIGQLDVVRERITRLRLHQFDE